jgi:hypothetical protein
MAGNSFVEQVVKPGVKQAIKLTANPDARLRAVPVRTSIVTIYAR